MARSRRTRVAGTAAAGAVLLAAATSYAMLSRPATHAAGADALHDVMRPGRLLVVSGGHLATVSATGAPDRAKRMTSVSCVRAYAASGTGVCLRQDGAWTYSLHVLDAHLRDSASYPLRGLPNRARVSSSGRMVSWTSFIGGESYNKGGFSTRTGILDTATGEQVPTLESFHVTLDGRPYRAVDLNVWGVTFTSDDNRFYATMSTQGVRYLVEGSFTARTMRTLATNVECPSLSPDGTRIAFKQAIDDNPVNGWRLSVLDLATMDVTHLAETRSIDDQPAWLDDATVAYTFRDSAGTPSVWSTPADGSGRPSMRVSGAESPALLS